MTDKKEGDSPLHIAARSKNAVDIVRVLIHGYQQEAWETLEPLYDFPPWKTKNKNGDTPLRTHHSIFKT
ncbi:hypothetical protein SOVF_053690 [Spinacia oleracea]|nr:hypothetical protein SOVF_053690 [Spinacia oleracea]